MATFKSLLETANGLYRDQQSDSKYLRDELLERLPNDILASPVMLQKVGIGTYTVRVEHPNHQVFDLFSRRRAPRLSGPDGSRYDP